MKKVLIHAQKVMEEVGLTTKNPFHLRKQDKGKGQLLMEILHFFTLHPKGGVLKNWATVRAKH